MGEEGLLSLAVVLFRNATKRRRKMLQTYIGAYVYDASTLEVEARRAGFEASLGHAARPCLERPKPSLSQTCHQGLHQELAHAHGTHRPSSLHLPFAHGITWYNILRESRAMESPPWPLLTPSAGFVPQGPL